MKIEERKRIEASLPLLMNITQVQEVLQIGQRKASKVVHKFGCRYGGTWMINREALANVIVKGF